MRKRASTNPSKVRVGKLSKTLPPHPCETLGGHPAEKRQSTHTPFDLKVRRKRKKRNQSYGAKALRKNRKPSDARWPDFTSFGDVMFF